MPGKSQRSQGALKLWRCLENLCQGSCCSQKDEVALKPSECHVQLGIEPRWPEAWGRAAARTTSQIPFNLHLCEQKRECWLQVTEVMKLSVTEIAH